MPKLQASRKRGATSSDMQSPQPQSDEQINKEKSQEYSQKFLESLFDDAMFSQESPEKTEPAPAKKAKTKPAPTKKAKVDKETGDTGLILLFLERNN